MVCAILRPATPGGLTYLKLPPFHGNNDGTTIHDVKLMEQHLLDHSRQHFWHAHGTPYTVPPLSELLGFNGLTPLEMPFLEVILYLITYLSIPQHDSC